jgi:hypothetical protein
MSLKFRRKNQVLPSFENLMDDDSVVSDELEKFEGEFEKDEVVEV